MLTNKAALLAASGPSVFTVVFNVVTDTCGIVWSETQKLKVGESVILPGYIDSYDLLPSAQELIAHGVLVEPNILSTSWHALEYINGDWKFTLNRPPPYNGFALSLEAMEDGGG